MAELMPATRKAFTFDTCVILKICQGERNFAECLKCRIGFADSEILLNSKTVEEMERHGFDYGSVSEKLSEVFETAISFTGITDDMFTDAKYMQRIYPTLHSGDDEVLAFTIATNSILITCDKGLFQAAKRAKAIVINPDIIEALEIPQSPSSVKRTFSNLIKPGTKITWRAFA